LSTGESTLFSTTVPACPKLIPGMPVDVSLETGSRTALEYFLEPITAVFRHGMRER
jgi:hypothetical protein